MKKYIRRLQKEWAWYMWKEKYLHNQGDPVEYLKDTGEFLLLHMKGKLHYLNLVKREVTPNLDSYSDLVKTLVMTAETIGESKAIYKPKIMRSGSVTLVDYMTKKTDTLCPDDKLCHLGEVLMRLHCILSEEHKPMDLEYYLRHIKFHTSDLNKLMDAIAHSEKLAPYKPRD